MNPIPKAECASPKSFAGSGDHKSVARPNQNHEIFGRRRCLNNIPNLESPGLMTVTRSQSCSTGRCLPLLASILGDPFAADLPVYPLLFAVESLCPRQQTSICSYTQIRLLSSELQGISCYCSHCQWIVCMQICKRLSQHFKFVKPQWTHDSSFPRSQMRASDQVIDTDSLVTQGRSRSSCALESRYLSASVSS